MTSRATALPRWDMTVIYPSLTSPEFAQGFQAVIERIGELGQLFDTHQIGAGTALASDEAGSAVLETIVERYNAVLEQTRTLQAYISSFIATNSRDDLAQARQSELQRHLLELTKLETRFKSWVGGLDLAALSARSAVAAAHLFPLQRDQHEATHLMSPAEEALAAELDLSGGTAWAKLHGNLTSQLTIPFERDGRLHELPMSVIRNLAFDADRELRRRAYEAELDGWERVALPLAAALNGIKGQTLTLTARRGWESPLAHSLFANSIDQQVLDTMLAAARDAFPDYRRYMHAKARAIGVPQLAWYDLFAPVGTSDRAWSYDEATAFILKQFGTYSARMRDYAARAFDEQWIDAEPHAGKRDGAFCMSLRHDESRIFLNFKPSFGSVRTLAHELGHGYHNLNLAERTQLQRRLPMTLAETASIFCETIVREAALREADSQEQIAILEASIQGSCQVVVDITSRFLFEQRVFEARQQRELSIDEFNQLMLETQRETYGDGLDQSLLHPYMWAVKGHYYSASRSFYNYPYMFGLLFGLGLYARYRQDPEAFTAGYDELLSATGMADAPTLAARFGIDLYAPEFWRASFDVIRADINRFEQLIAPGLQWNGPADDA